MTSKTQEFLRAILPEQGVKVACIFRKGAKPQQRFTTSFEDLERILLTEDGLGHTVYHACASFKSSDSRKAANALGAKSLWADIDAGDGKAYPDAATAAHAVLAFCRDTSLPVPIFVGSGNGLHLYWPLDRILDVGTWLGYSRGLKDAFHRHGIKDDPTRTADISSILRTPGSHWRKVDPPRIVQVGEIVGPYGLERFAALDVGPAPSPRAAAFLAPAGKPTKLFGLNERVGMIYGDDPKADAVADGCEQVRAMRDRHGQVPEPHWHAAIGVLRFCEDGLEKALEWSSGGFNAQIEEKFRRAEKLSGATTCAHFHGVIDRAVCERCPLFQHITSPTQAGRAAAPAKPAPVVQVSATADPAPIDPAKPWGELPPLREPFSWGEDGSLVMATENRKGEPATQVISRYPIHLAGIQTAEAAGNRYSYVFRQYLPNKGWVDIALGAGKTVGQNGISEMFDQGAMIQDRDLFRKYLMQAIAMQHEQRGVQMKFDQFGWKENETAFLWGKRLFKAGGNEVVSGGEEVNLRGQWLLPRPGADLRKWSEAANVFFAKGSEPQAVALLAGFAAPLMRFHATDEGGAVLSLVSPKSGTGKTTALAAGASIWGRMEGLSLTNIDTRVSKAITLGVLGNLPVIYDELSNRDPEVVKEFIMVFTNGRDKMRGTVEGGIRHTAAHWQTILLTASNLSIVDLISSTSNIDAPGFRVLELQVSVPPGREAQIGDKLRQTLDRNCGVAGEAYLNYLMQADVLAYVKEAIPRLTAEMWARTKLETQHRFWVRTIASIAVAAQMVRQLGILEFSPQRIVDWLVEQVAENRDEAPAAGGRDAAIGALSEYLSDHFSHTLVVKGAFKAHTMQEPIVSPVQRLLIRYETENKRLYISEKMLREWLTKKGYGSRSTLKDLEEKGIILQKRRYITLSAGTKFPGGQQPCVEINAAHPEMSGLLTPLEVFQTQAVA